MSRLGVSMSVLNGFVSNGTERAINNLRCDRQRGDTHADGVLDGVSNRGRRPEGPRFADPFGSEGPCPLLGLDHLAYHCDWDVEKARNLVIGERGVSELT